MKNFIKELSFGVIQRNKSIHNNIVTIINNAYRKNTTFWGTQPNKFRIILCDTEEELKKEARYKYVKWGTAYYTEDSVISRSPESIEKIGLWRKRDFENIITHEMSHVFWRYFCNSSRSAHWLREGVACYLGNNFPVTNKSLKEILKKYQVSSNILIYWYSKKKISGHIPFYPVWQKFTEYMIDKYSKQKLLDLMKIYSKNPVKRRFQINFQKVYGLKEKELFDEFLNSVKT